MTRDVKNAPVAALAAIILSVVASVSGQAPAPAPQGAPPPAPSGAIQRRVAPPARIIEFKSDRTEIRPGESVSLTWATENPTAVAIEPDLGRAAPRGSRRVTPSATTTYTLSVTGPNGTATRAVTITVAGTTPRVAAPAASDAPAKKEAPRTADGRPDLSGIFGYGQGGRGGAPAPAGSLPTTPTLKPGAEKYRVVRAPDDTGQYAGCLPPGIPQSFMVPYYIQIVQAPKHVVVLHEYLNLHRVIPTDGRAHPADPDPSWMGHAVGRWDGDTLVVDSIGFNDKTEISGFRHTEALHVVERFRRLDAETLQYEATIEDPNVFAGPWVIRRTFPLLPEYDRLEEFVCENNRDYKGLFDSKK